MYGYVVPDKPNMYVKDYDMFRAYYCGLCKTLGKTGNQFTRFATSYDGAFLSALAHAATNTSPKIKPEACVLNPFKKRPVVMSDELSKRVADAVILLARYKADDDKRDRDKKSFAARVVLYNRYKSAARRMPVSDGVMKEAFKRLARLESENSRDLDALADCFSSALAAAVKEVVGEDFYTDNVNSLCYNLGRWVYFTDAVDDLDQDFEKHRFNPFITEGFESKALFLEKKRGDAEFLINSSYNKVVAAYNNMIVETAEGVLSNTIYLGMPLSAERVLSGGNKSKYPRI
ncbi:MAG: DUF5685 family protein [Clostridiaceae bacterium]|jgi:hypothetical protein|nr:DUF5685 family protein [Clostridiaceae bacterium]